MSTVDDINDSEFQTNDAPTLMTFTDYSSTNCTTQSKSLRDDCNL